MPDFIFNSFATWFISPSFAAFLAFISLPSGGSGSDFDGIGATIAMWAVFAAHSIASLFYYSQLQG